MRSITTLLVAACYLLLLSNSLQAHPLAPGLLALIEVEDNRFQALWKLPNRTADSGRLQPELPDNCSVTDIQAPVAAGTGRSQSFRLNCDGPLVGSTFGVSGMDPSTAGVLLRINFLDQRVVHQMLRYEQSTFTVPPRQSAVQVFGRYLVLGIDHLIEGIDHVLFVITLAILVGWSKQLIWTITLFTLGHSVTLSLTALGFIYFPIFLVEAIIALSIAWAAADIARQDKPGLLRKRPWLMSGGFGLLHGMGFASALAQIGLPQQSLTLALAAFNIGIEIGQLIIIALFFLALGLLRLIPLQWPSAIRPLAGYFIGTIGALWFWQRLLGF